MFYSHEVLTSRKYGIATCWLAATLGEKSTLRKVNRKEIFGVNVPKACDTILNPEAPLALRLQSGLLIGVTRVFHQQCGYILTDAEHASTTIKELLRHLSTTQPTTDTGHVAKRDHITLRDDPNFNLDFDPLGLGFDSAPVHVALPDSNQVFSLELHSNTGGHSVDAGSFYQDLIIPPSGNSPSLLADVYASSIGRGPDRLRLGSRPQSALDDAEDGLLEDPGFGFDAHGNFVEGPVNDRVVTTSAVQTPLNQSQDERLYESARPEGSAQHISNLEDPMPIDMDDQIPADVPDEYIDVQPFPTTRTDHPALPVDENADDSTLTSIDTHDLVQSQQQGPKRKPIPLDQNLEITNADLATWMAQYPALMNATAHSKMMHRVITNVRPHSDGLFGLAGIAGLGLGGSSLVPGALDMFTGRRLVEALTDLRHGRSRKRSADVLEDAAESVDGSEGERRVRQRIENQIDEQGRGAAMDDAIMDDPLGLIEDQTMEFGRQMETPLVDQRQSTTMPWNASASVTVRGSSIRPGSRRGMFSGSIPQSIRPLGSRVPSLDYRGNSVGPSPLIGLGSLPHSYGSIQGLPEQLNFDGIAMPTPSHIRHADAVTHAPLPEVDNLDAAANSGVPIQNTQNSLWQQTAFQTETENFMLFVQTRIHESAAQIGLENELDNEAGQNEISYEALLPPEMHTAMVAAQGFLHVLSLGTRNMLLVRQEHAYGEIVLGLV